MVLNLPLNQQKSASSVLEFSTLETTPLFDVYSRSGGLQGVYSRSGGLGPLVKLANAWFTVQSAITWMKFTRG